MTIEKYFDIVESFLSKLELTKESQLSFEKDPSEKFGKIRGVLYFEDGSFLKIFESTRLKEGEIIATDYSYYYGTGEQLFFRYDSKPEKRYRKLKTYPHHLHTSQGKVVESDIEEINLQEVLRKIIRSRHSRIFVS